MKPWLLISWLAVAPGISVALDGAAAPEYRVLSDSASQASAGIRLASVSTPAVVTVGDSPRFELEFADVADGTGKGFDDPQSGALRRELAVAVFTRLGKILQGEPGSARIRLDSRSPWLNDQTLAVGIPLFRCRDGFEKPIIFDALRNDVHVHEIEGELLVNFDLPLSASTGSPQPGTYDLYTLLLHEAVHFLGFVGFTVEPDGRPRDCGGARMLPAVAGFARNESGARLWVEDSGGIRYTGSVEDLPGSGRAIWLDQNVLAGTDLRLESASFRVSGHWLPEDYRGREGVLMLREPFPTGSKRRNLTPETKAVLGEMLGYRVNQEMRGLSGGWIDPERDGQGFTIHFLGEDRFAVYFFGFLNDGRRQWMVGYHQGTFALGSTLELQLYEANGGRFSQPAPGPVTETPWGTLQLNFVDCHRAEALLSGIDGTTNMALVPLTRIDSLDCY